MLARTRILPARTNRPDDPRARALAEVETLGWLLDRSMSVPGTGGRRFGIDGIIGLVPGVGDLVGGLIGLFLVWRASRMGLPSIVVARMLITTLIDMTLGAIPFVGDVFDFWFKSNARNLDVMRRHLERPDRSTHDDWAAVLAVVGAVLAIVIASGWLLASALGAVFGVFS
jgi:hypothetical protein